MSVIDEWFGALPDGWQRLKLKYVADFINGAAFKPSDWGAEGTPIIRIQNLNGGSDFNYTTKTVRERNHVHQGDVLFGWSGNRGTSFGPFRWTESGLYYLNQHIFLVRDYGHNKLWLYWALKAVTEEVEKRAHGIIGMVHITRPELDQTPIPVPPLPMQRAIANFLDRKTAVIDALIERKERLLELLAEKRAALIHQAVTKGLDPSVPMKDSGMSWIGEIPVHWSVSPLKHSVGSSVRFGLQMGPFGASLTHISRTPKPCSVFGQANTISGDFETVSRWLTFEQFAGLSKYRLLPGDIVLTRKGSLGNSRLVPDDIPLGIIDSDTIRLRVDERAINPGYIAFLLHEAYYLQQQISVHSRGAILPGLNTSVVGNLQIITPPLAEQATLLKYLVEKTQESNQIATTLREQVLRLNEYRQALITAAVTGQVDITQEPAPLPPETSASTPVDTSEPSTPAPEGKQVSLFEVS